MNKKNKRKWHFHPYAKRAYCSMSHNFSTFSIPHDALFLVFGVPNAKYLAFDTPDENALK